MILKNFKLKLLVNRIEFWIILFFLVRLIGITNPPLEIGHNWRQITGLMVARNFLEIDSNILYPRIDDLNGTNGIIGMEFPFMNYLYFLIAKIFGYTHWYGRLLNLIVSSVSVFFFYKIVSKYWSHKIGLIASILLTCSIWFAFSRKMMPDTFCISLILIGIYFGLKFLEKGKIYELILYVIFSSLAILTKIPAGIYLAVLIVPFFSKKIHFNNKLLLSSSTLIPLLLTFLWYFVWNPYLQQKFGTWSNTGKDIFTGMNEIFTNIDIVLKRFYFDSFYSYTFFGVFLIGLLLIFYKKEKILISSFLILFFVFLIYMFKSGDFFFKNSYYIITFLPVMSLVAGFALSQINKNWMLILVMLTGISESIINQHQDFRIKESQLYKLELEVIADSISKKNDLIAIYGEGSNPQQLYLSHRKGFTYNSDYFKDSVFVYEIINKGCKYLFIDKTVINDTINFENIFENNYYVVYNLEKPL